MTKYGVADHPYQDFMKDLWEQGNRATAIVEELEAAGYPTVNKKTLARYGQRYWSEPTVKVTSDEHSDLDLPELITKASSQGEIKKVSIVEKKYADERQFTSHTVEIVPDIGADSEPFEVSVGPFEIKPPKKTQSSKPDGFELLISFPDKQTGYFKNHRDEFEPVHDEAAINVAYQIATDLQANEGIDVVVNSGDDLDFAEFSSHRSSPGYKGLLNKNLNRHATDLAMQRQMAPDAKIVQLFGNHEARLEKFLVDRAPDLIGVTRVGEDDPILSIPYLCKYDDYDIEVRRPYPQGSFWANDYLKFVHGTATSSIPGGAAAKTLSKSGGVSVVFGHDHFLALVRDRVDTPNGRRDVFAASGGCLCRLDGLVPSSSGGISSTGKQVSDERWQQGMLVIYYEPKGLQRVYVEPVHIDKGSALFRGKFYTSSVDVNGNPNDNS